MQLWITCCIILDFLQADGRLGCVCCQSCDSFFGSHNNLGAEQQEKYSMTAFPREHFAPQPLFTCQPWTKTSQNCNEKETFLPCGLQPFQKQSAPDKGISLNPWHQARTWAVQVAPLQYRLGINTLQDKQVSADEAAGCSHLAAFPPASFCQFWVHTCNSVRCQQKSSTQWGSDCPTARLPCRGDEEPQSSACEFPVGQLQQQ